MDQTTCESQARSIRKRVAEWLRDFTRETYGENGCERLAAQLGVPAGTLLNYELGCTIPAEFLVILLELSDIDPHWLATGEGPKYLGYRHESARDQLPRSRHSVGAN